MEAVAASDRDAGHCASTGPPVMQGAAGAAGEAKEDKPKRKDKAANSKVRDATLEPRGGAFRGEAWMSLGARPKQQGRREREWFERRAEDSARACACLAGPPARTCRGCSRCTRYSARLVKGLC